MQRMFILLIFFTLGSFNLVSAQTGWVQIGSIEGANVRDIHLAINGDLYAATFNDVYRSTDNGESWTQIFFGTPEFTDIAAAVSHDREGNVAVYVVSLLEEGGFLVSFDNGATWSEFELPAEVQEVTFGVSICGSVSGTLYLYGNTNESVAKLYSARNNSNNFTEELSIPDVNILDVTETPAGAVFAEVIGGVYRKLPDEEEWELVEAAGSPRELIPTAFEELVIIDNSNAMRSLDNGDTWEEINDGLGSYSRVWLSALSSGAVLLTGETGNAGGRQLLILPQGATTWELLHTNMPNNVRRFTEAHNGDILGGYRLGLIVTREGSRTFATRRADFHSLPIWQLAGSGDWLYAVTFEGDLFRSGDGGATWDVMFFPVALTGDLAVRDILATTGGTVLISTRRGMYRSTDNGTTWALFTLDDPERKIKFFYEASDGAIYASAQSSKMLYRSDDAGATWATIGDELPEFPDLISANADGSIIVGSRDGLWRLEENTTWTRLGLEGNSLPFVFGSRDADNIVALGEQNYTDIAFRGDAQGADWETLPIGLSGDVEPLILDAARSADGGVFCAAFEGLFHLAPAAQQWREDDLSVELDGSNIITALHTADQGTYAATAFSAIYKRDAISSVADDRLGGEARVYVYPQPARDRTTIAFHSATSGVARITLRNAMGGLALEIAHDMPAAGAQSLEIDTQALAAGIYSVHIGAQRHIVTGALVVLR